MATITQLKIRRPDDFHVHLREGVVMQTVVPYTAKVFGRALVMPNLKNPITTGEMATEYEDEILHATDKPEMSGFTQSLMTIKLTQETSPVIIAAAASADVKAVKLYPEGVTTNSENGVRDVDALTDTFRAMSDVGMVLCIHAEEPGVFSLDREIAYLERVQKIAENHPRLKVIIEHVTTSRAIAFVEDAGPNVAATITAHHLLLTLDDVIGDKFNPHNFCKPIAKRPSDRDTLVRAALSGDPKYFFGSDSAPHAKETKECASGCAGCFTAPIAMELLAAVFDKAGCLDKLEAFTSEFGAKFYGLKLNESFITLERGKHEVPAMVHGAFETGVAIVPFKAETLDWKVV